MVVLAAFPLDKNAKQRKVRSLIQSLCRFYVAFMQFVCLIEYRVSGLRDIEPKGHLVISNHSMLIDALFALAYIDNLCCVVKHQLLSNPFTRFPVSLAGYISNDSHDLIDRACKKLADGENVLIFPEGTRNQYDTQLEFKRGAANIAVLSGCPVLPMVIVPSPRTVQKGEKWYQLPTIKSQIEMQLGDTLSLGDCIDTSQPRTIQCRRLNQFWRGYYLNKIQQAFRSGPALFGQLNPSL